MFISDQELHLNRHQLRHQDLQRRAEQARLVREARRATREEREQSEGSDSQPSKLVVRLFSLFF